MGHPAHFPTTLRLLVIALVAGALAGCSPADRSVAVRLGPSGPLEVAAPLCDERLQRVRLYEVRDPDDRGDDREVWDAIAEGDGREDAVLALEPQVPGYVVSGGAAAADLRPGTEYGVDLGLSGGVDAEGTFTLDDLPPDGWALLGDGPPREVTEEELEEAFDDECPVGLLEGIADDLVGAVLIGLAVLAILGVGAFVLVRLLSSRTRPPSGT